MSGKLKLLFTIISSGAIQKAAAGGPFVVKKNKKGGPQEQL